MSLFSQIGDALSDPTKYLGSALGKFNHLATKESWDYQTTHQYQNTVKDLRAAGLNPILGYQNGPNTASVSQASVGQLGDAVNSALSLTQMQKNKADAELASNTAREVGARADLEEKFTDFVLKNSKQFDQYAGKRLAPTSTAQAVTQGLKPVYDKVIQPTVEKVGQGVASTAKSFGESIGKGIEAVKGWFNGSGSTTKGGTN